MGYALGLRLGLPPLSSSARSSASIQLAEPVTLASRSLKASRRRGRLVPLSRLPQSVKEFKSLVRCAPLSFACEPVLVLTTRKRKAALLLEGKRWSQALRLLDLREWVASGLSLSKKKSQLLRRRTAGW